MMRGERKDPSFQQAWLSWEENVLKSCIFAISQ